MGKITLPELGEGIEKAVVAGWLCKVGERVEKDQEVVELVTDKASFSVTSDSSGVLGEIYVNEGEEAAIGQTLAKIE